MYFTVNLEMKKPTLCCCFAWIVFIELNFTVAFLFIRKTWDDRFVCKVGKWEFLRNGGILVMGDDLEWCGVDTSLGTICLDKFAMIKVIN